MLAAEDLRAARAPDREQAYADLYEEYVIDASSLWLRRSRGLKEPHLAPEDIAILERRLDDQLDGLHARIELGWPACEAALALGEPGEAFTAGVMAFHSGDAARIQKAVQAGLANARATPGLVSALGWLPGAIARPWVERLLRGKDLNHKYLGVAGASVRREDPGELLAHILSREDCCQHAPLHARALRLAGELRRADLRPALIAARSASDRSVRFAALGSLVLLGDRAAARDLHPYVVAPGPHRAKAIQFALRALPLAEARAWISALAQNPADQRAAIVATGVLGDPHAMPWLITKMTDPLLARLAGEAFTAITGLDLERERLAAPARLELVPGTPDDPADPHAGIEDDENLPWPDPDKIAVLWSRHGARFTLGQRYFLGEAIAAVALRRVLATGAPRQRRAAALELALLDPREPLVNISMKRIP